MAGNALGVVIGGVVIGAVAGVGGTLAVLEKQGKMSTGSPSASSSSETCAIEGAASSGSASGSLFAVDGQSYGAADLPADVQDVLFQVESQAYSSKRDFLEDVALRVALAKDKSGDVDTTQLPTLSDLIGPSEPSEEEMKDFYEKNKKNLPPDASYEQIKPQLKQFLANRSLSSDVSKRVSELEKAGRLSFAFVAPVPPLVDLPVADYPSKGGAAAAVTLVEVSDYLCPHCRNVKTEVTEVLKEFGDQIRFVQVDFALRPSGLSGVLVKGGYCARKESEETYWKYHDKAFEVPLDAAQSVSPDAAKEFKNHAVAAAKDVVSDVAAFETCLDSPEALGHVTKTNQVFSEKGVSGTPTFFLNNRKLVLAGRTLRDAVSSALSGPASN